MIPLRCLGHRAPLLWMVLPLIAGCVASRLVPCSRPLPWLVTGLCAALASGFAACARPKAWGWCLCLGLSLAGYANASRWQTLPDRWRGMPGREAELVVNIERVFDRTAEYASGIGIVMPSEGLGAGLQGRRVYYSLKLRPGQHPPQNSAVIRMAGILEVIEKPSSGADSGRRDFTGYLSGIGIQFRLGRARLQGEISPQTPYRRFCGRLALQMNGILAAGLESRPDLLSVYRAMMLGLKQDLTNGQRSAFLRSGTMHLFAINGLHIGIVALSLHAMLAVLRCPRALAAVLVVAVLWLDVDSTGRSPSAVRAFIMICVLEAARLWHRPANPLAALSAAALPVMLIEPWDIFSASFQLSYGVMTAIVTLGIPLSGWLQTRYPACAYVPRPLRNRIQRSRVLIQRHLLGALGVGLAAALVGAVGGAQFFGVVAPAGLLVGTVVAPLAGLVIVAGVLSIFWGLGGAVVSSALPAGLAAHVAASISSDATVFLNGASGLLLRGIEAAVSAGARIPAGNFAVQLRAPWVGPAALLALLSACMVGYAGRWRRTVCGWWLPIAVVAVTLVFGARFGVASPP